jgi:signal transduction histidine kinase
MKKEIVIFRRVSITEKFILYFLLVYIFAIGITSGTIFYSAKDALLSRTSEQLTSIKYVKKRQIENFFKDRINNVTELQFILENNDIFKQHLVDFKIKNFIERFIQSGNYFNGFMIIEKSKITANYSKIPEYKIPEKLNSDVIRKIKIINKNPFILDFSINPITNEGEIYICILINSNSIRNSILILRISNASINDIMLENNANEGLGQTGESYLVGMDYLMRSKSRFIENSIFKIKAETESVKKALQNHSGTSIIYDYRNIKVLSSYIKLNIPNLNWAVIAEIDFDEAMIPVKEMQQKILILTIFLSLIIFFITYFITIQITKPLKKLTNASIEIGKGNFTEILPNKYNDEIGELTTSFNLLSQNLLQKDKELKNERLKRFSLVMDEQELERERLSRELHDGLGQMFIALKLKLEAVDENSEINMNLIEDFKLYLDDTIDEIRRISNNLMPSVLKEFGLITAVSNLCNMFNYLAKTNFIFETNINTDISDKKKKIYIFRIIQESLNNILKHSEAKNAIIRLTDGKIINLNISDDGKGFNLDEALKGHGNGIYNMRERVFALKGRINIETSQSMGTLIQIEIPD